MIMRWLSCGTGNMHIVGTCAGCYGTQGGLLLGTFATGYAGRISAKCVDCGKAIDYYVDSGGVQESPPGAVTCDMTDCPVLQTVALHTLN
jgi:hypothetical protein